MLPLWGLRSTTHRGSALRRVSRNFSEFYPNFWFLGMIANTTWDATGTDDWRCRTAGNESDDEKCARKQPNQIRWWNSNTDWMDGNILHNSMELSLYTHSPSSLTFATSIVVCCTLPISKHCSPSNNLLFMPYQLLFILLYTCHLFVK